MEKRVFLNLDYCCGCKSCAAACSQRYYNQSNLAHGEVDEVANLPFHCQHCEEAPCVDACPNGAMSKGEDGVVRRSHFLCVGCGSCVFACPFGIIAPKEKYHIYPKCDLCSDRLIEGKIPRCVATCTSGALSFEDIEGAFKDEKKILISSRMQEVAIGRRR